MLYRIYYIPRNASNLKQYNPCKQTHNTLYNKAMRQHLTHRLNFYIYLFIIALTRRFGEFLRLIGDNNHLLPHLYFHEVYALKGQNRDFQYQVGRG